MHGGSLGVVDAQGRGDASCDCVEGMNARIARWFGVVCIGVGGCVHREVLVREEEPPVRDVAFNPYVAAWRMAVNPRDGSGVAYRGQSCPWPGASCSGRWRSRDKEVIPLRMEVGR